MNDVAAGRSPSPESVVRRDAASRWGLGLIALIVVGTAVAVVLLVSNAKTSQREQAAVRACEIGAMSASSPTGTASVTAAMSDDASVMGEWPRYRVRGSIEVQDVGGPGRLVDYTCVVIGGEDDGAPGLSYTVRDISVTPR